MIFIIKDNFLKQINNLSKKFTLINNDFQDFQDTFSINNGKHLGKGIYKFRMKNSSIKSGKSGGFRIIVLAKIEENKIFPFIIYSKTEKENIILNEIIQEFKKYI